MSIRIALIGTGGISLANHVPGIALDRDADVVAVCDVSPAALEAASTATGVRRVSADPVAGSSSRQESITLEDVHWPRERGRLKAIGRGGKRLGRARPATSADVDGRLHSDPGS